MNAKKKPDEEGAAAEKAVEIVDFKPPKPKAKRVHPAGCTCFGCSGRAAQAAKKRHGTAEPTPPAAPETASTSGVGAVIAWGAVGILGGAVLAGLAISALRRKGRTT